MFVLVGHITSLTVYLSACQSGKNKNCWHTRMCVVVLHCRSNAFSKF